MLFLYIIQDDLIGFNCNDEQMLREADRIVSVSGSPSHVTLGPHLLPVVVLEGPIYSVCLCLELFQKKLYLLLISIIHIMRKRSQLCYLQIDLNMSTVSFFIIFSLETAGHRKLLGGPYMASWRPLTYYIIKVCSSGVII